MKTLIVPQKIVVSIVTVMLLMYGAQGISYGQQNDALELTPVCDRTPQVRDAIVALVPGVDDCKDVTADHLSLITNIDLNDQNITALKVGDFDGMSSLEWIDLGSNQLSSLPAGVFSGLSSLGTINLSRNNLSSLPANIFSGLSALKWIALSSNNLNSLPTGLFSGLSSLSWISLASNSLSSLPANIFSGLSALRSLYLGDNSVDLSVTVSLEQVGENQFQATVPTGAPFNIVLPFSVTNGSVDNGATTITIPTGGIESETLAVTPTPGTSDPTTIEIETLPGLPTTHDGYRLVDSRALAGDDEPFSLAVGIPIPTYDPNANHAPVFAEGISTMRSVAENTDAGVNIGSPVLATDADDDPLTYGLEGPDAAAFGIVGTTGQLQTRAPLDYEARDAYAVTVIVSDGRGGADTIGVAISVTDENDDPIFIEGDNATRSVAENTDASVNIGGAVSATDEDGDILTYSLGGIDASSFGIISTSGQLQTRAELDYETKDAYSVTVMVSDGNGGTDTIGVAISVTDENDDPIFIEGDGTTRAVAENTLAGVNIGGAVSATDEDGDPLAYTLGGIDAASFGIVGTTGQLQTRAELDYETKNAYAVTVRVSDGNGGTDTIGVTISVTDMDEDTVPVIEGIVIPVVDETPETHAPVFEGDSTTRSIPENTPAGVNVGSPVSAIDADDDTLTYTLGGTDAVAFSIVGSSGQLQTQAPLDYETKNAYTVTVTVSDGGRTDAISVTITIIDVDETPETHAPVFEGDSTTRSIPENTPAGVNIGPPVSATDDDEDTLTYTLGGTDAVAFSIVGSSGQLQTQAPLDYETKNAYTVTVTVSDGGRTDAISVTITIIDVDETPETHAPIFAGSRTTRSIAENTSAGVNIGSPVSATDVDDDTLTYTLGGTDATSFSIVGSSGQLQTQAPLDFETKNAYTVTVTVSDGGRTDAITVVITIIDVDETPRPDKVGGEVSISEIMYGSEIRFSPKQWIEISNSGAKPINLTGWTLTIQNVDSEDLLGPVTATINFRDATFDDAPRIWPNDVLLIVTSATHDHSGGFTEDQVYDLRWREKRREDLDIGFWTTWLSTEGFYITLTDKDGNLVDEAGNSDGNTTLWDLPYGFNRGRIRAGNRTSLIRRYVDGIALDGTQAGGWISATDANLTADQQTYYGDENDISTPGIGIIINEISTQFIEYDVNQDGVVNISDLVLVAGRLGQSGPNAADVNGDGVVNIQDLILVAGVLNQTPAAPPLHPASLAMFTTTDIRGWLAQAHGLDLTDPKLQSGIRFLEQLLSVLVPKETELLPNYPNPFNPETWIPYRLAEDAFVTLVIYDQRGSVVRRFNVGHQAAAVYESRSQAIYWDGRNEGGDRVASAIYFYTLTAGDYSATRKLVILK